MGEDEAPGPREGRLGTFLGPDSLRPSLQCRCTRTHAHRFPVHIHPCVVIYLVVRSRIPLVCGPRLFRSSHDLRENPAGLRQMPPEGLSEDDSGHVPTGTPVASSFCYPRQEGKAGQLWDH